MDADRKVGEAIGRQHEVITPCRSNESVSANLRRMATVQENIPIQLLMMDYARSATKRRERLKQILWVVRPPHQAGRQRP